MICMLPSSSSAALAWEAIADVICFLWCVLSNGLWRTSTAKTVCAQNRFILCSLDTRKRMRIFAV